jgi:iron(III) transport system permease protein
MGLCLLPWYALQDSFFGLTWLKHWLSEQQSPALLQMLLHKRLWLLPLCALPLLLLYWRHTKIVITAGVLGFVYALAQGFVLHTGQPGMGAGALCFLAGAVLLTAEGIARLGYFRGDRFVATSLVGITILVLLFVFFPLLRVLWAGVVDPQGALSFTAFWQRFAQAKLWHLNLACLWGGSGCGVAWNTLYLALWCGLGTTFLGLMLALIVTRLPGYRRIKQSLRVLSVLPIITPPFVIGLGLIMLFGRSGVVNQFLEWAFGIPQTRWIYGMPGVLLAQLFAFTPVAFLVLIGVVEGVSNSLEEAAQSLHASPWQGFKTVTLPLMIPGLGNAFLVGFIESIADFGNPVVLGGNFSVLSTEVYFAIVGAQLDQGKAAVYSLILLAFALLAFFLQQSLSHRKSFVTITGKGDSGLPSPLPRRVKRLAIATAIPWLTLTVIIYGMCLLGGFTKVWGRDHTLTFDHFIKAFDFTINQHGLLFTGAAWNSLWNTLQFSLAAAPLSAIIGLLAAYLIARTQFLGQRAFEFLTLLSFAIPGTVIGVAYIFAFNVPPIELTGTGVIIVLCFIFRNLPVGVRGGIAAFAQLDKSLDEASSTLGASGATTFRLVLLPLLKSAVVGALVYGFVRSMTTVSAIIFLVSGETEVATTYIIGRVVNGDYGVSIAYCAVLILLMITVIWGIQKLVGTRELGRRQLALTG